MQTLLATGKIQYDAAERAHCLQIQFQQFHGVSRLPGIDAFRMGQQIEEQRVNLFEERL